MTTAIESVESVSSFSPLCNIIIYLWNIFAVSYFEVCLQGSLIFQALFHKWKRRKSQSHYFPKMEKKCKFKTTFKKFFLHVLKFTFYQSFSSGNIMTLDTAWKLLKKTLYMLSKCHFGLGNIFKCTFYLGKSHFKWTVCHHHHLTWKNVFGLSLGWGQLATSIFWPRAISNHLIEDLLGLKSQIHRLPSWYGPGKYIINQLTKTDVKNFVVRLTCSQIKPNFIFWHRMYTEI